MSCELPLSLFSLPIYLSTSLIHSILNPSVYRPSEYISMFISFTCHPIAQCFLILHSFRVFLETARLKIWRMATSKCFSCLSTPVDT